MQNKNINKKGGSLEKKAGVSRVLKNGSVGTWKKQNCSLVFRFTKGANAQYLNEIRGGAYRSPKNAQKINRQRGGWANYEEAFVVATKPDGTPVYE